MNQQRDQHCENYLKLISRSRVLIIPIPPFQELNFRVIERTSSPTKHLANSNKVQPVRPFQSYIRRKIKSGSIFNERIFKNPNTFRRLTGKERHHKKVSLPKPARRAQLLYNEGKVCAINVISGS
jgi:hypothetical protein